MICIQNRRPGRIGEVWTATATVASSLGGDDLDAALDFVGTEGLRKGVELRTSAMWRGARCQTGLAGAGAWGRFAGNHDMPRLADLASDLVLQHLVLAAVLLVPGTPRIYYGDELGLPSGPDGGDRR